MLVLLTNSNTSIINIVWDTRQCSSLQNFCMSWSIWNSHKTTIFFFNDPMFPLLLRAPHCVVYFPAEASWVMLWDDISMQSSNWQEKKQTKETGHKQSWATKESPQSAHTHAQTHVSQQSCVDGESVCCRSASRCVSSHAV